MSFSRLYSNVVDALQQTEGLGVLSDAESVQILRDSNQIPTLTETYPSDGRFASVLQRDMILVNNMGFKPEEKNQGFRISNITKSQDTITITAPHVCGDLANIKLVQQVTAPNCTPMQAWNLLTQAFVYQMPMVSFYSDVFKVANINWEMSDDPVTSILLGEDQAGDKPTNTFQALYGVDFYFNNYSIKALNNKAHDTGKIIKWHQNMTGITADWNTDSYYDGIIPYAKYTPNTVPDDSTTEGTKYDAVGDVQYVGAGQAETFDTPYKGHHVIGHLRNGTYYHVKATQSKNTVNNDTWYQLDNGQWIDEHFFTFDKSKAYVVNKLKNGAQGTITIPDNSTDSNGLIVSYTGVGSIVYAGRGKVAVWNSPFPGHSLTGKYLANGSRWKIFQKANVSDGHVWYNLGGEQWVDGQYLSLQKTTDFVATPTHGILQIIKKPVSYTTPGMQKQTNWNPKAKSRWRVSQWATGADGSTLYRVSTWIWVKGDDDTVTFSENGTVQPNQDNDNLAVAKKTGKVPIYSAPDGTHATEHWVKVGDKLQIFSQADNNGKTWYEIGQGQWVDASYFNFEADDDVAPGDDNSDSSDESDVEVEEQTIMLPEKYILANTAVHTEHPKLQLVDLSEYFNGLEPTPDKLREIAQAYIREYRIGIVPFTVTVQDAEFDDEYKYLNSIDLYDIVGVQNDELGIAQKAKVTSVTWDDLLERYTSRTIGQLPIDYDHALGNYIEEQNAKTKETASKKATHLFGELHQIVKKQGSDQVAALQNLAKELDIDYHQNSASIKNLKSRADEIDAKVSESQQTIEAMGAVFQAYPSWQSPQEIRAKNSDGSAMVFTSNGLGFIGTDGILRSGMDINGNISGEHIVGGTITGLTLDGVRVTGTSYINSSGDVYNAVMSSQNGISVSSTSGGDTVRLTNEKIQFDYGGVISFGGITIRRTNGYAGDTLYLHDAYGDHALGGKK
ncbi:phage tail spike protein [Lactobacillus hominis]|uniref:phage tail spike protein n=1 Tax=Lactobacillus hominis TaxID=1203033 RepID=UPI0023F18607|nr:phage tail spike protein [Lactobacillus hominis]